MFTRRHEKQGEGVERGRKGRRILWGKLGHRRLEKGREDEEVKAGKKEKR